MNSRIIGTLADETGCIEAGKLIWSDYAWKQLFFPESKVIVSPPDASSDYEDSVCPATLEVAVLDPGLLQSIEERLVYTRITMVFGWSSTVGMLCVLGVRL